MEEQLERLDSWKEIAFYLGRTERTVRRWEEREGLPVHRLVHEKRGSVYAFKRELDTWRQSRKDTIEANAPEELSPSPDSVQTATVGPARPHLRRVLSIVALAALAAAILWVAGARLQRHKVSSIAVLPFENLSKNADDEWFSDGMTETLITELSRVRSLRVISRNSVMQYKNAHTPLKQIRDELGVDAVVEGSALRVGDRVRITAQLIEASTHLHLWRNDYDRDLKDILGLHREVARAIAQDVGATLTASDNVAARPVDPQAAEAYLKGLYIGNRRELKRAAELAREAIRLDPQFALAHELLGEILILEADSHQVSYAEVIPEARTALRRSLEIEPDRGRPISILGYSSFVADHNWEEAEPALRRGFELDPGTGCIYGFFLSAKGEFDKAIEVCQQELLRDLANPATHADMGMLKHFARRYGESIASFRKALDLSPENRYPHFYLPFTYILAGQPDEAFESWLPWITGPRRPLAGLDARFRAEYRSGGWNAVWRAWLDMQPADPRMRLRAYLALQRKDDAFAELNKLEKTNDAWISRLEDPIYDSIRREPRFRAMLQRLRYPESMWR